MTVLSYSKDVYKFYQYVSWNVVYDQFYHLIRQPKTQIEFIQCPTVSLVLT